MIGTTDKILTNLHKMSTDKKCLLTKRYDDNAAWMETELRKIHALLGKPLPEAQSSSVATIEVEKVEVVRISDENSRQKRKSPDMAVGSTRHSPDQKRVSTDYAQLAVDAGLPADLNRLKKEQLLGELEARGDQTYTIKALKKELVDALKDILAAEDMKAKLGAGVNMTQDEEELGAEEIEAQPVEESTEEEMVLADGGISVQESVDSDAVVEEASEEAEPMVEHVDAKPTVVEETVGAEVACTTTAVDMDPQQALQQRMARHRDSKARKSVAAGNLAADEAGAADVPLPEPTTAVTAEPLPEPEPESVANSPMKDGGMWTDVNSPMAEAATKQTVAPRPTAPVAAAPVPVAAPMKASNQIGSGTLTSFSVASKAAATTNSTKSSLPAFGANALKKPSNLVSGSGAGGAPTSFVPSHTVAPAEKPKPVVPALAQAAKLREQEEARALQKKQAQLQAQQAKAAPAHGITTASIISKANMTINSNKDKAPASGTHTSAKARLHPPPVLSTASNEAKKVLQSAVPAVPTTPSADKTAAPAAMATTTPGGGVAQIFGFLNPFKGATGTPGSTAKPAATTPASKLAPAAANKAPVAASTTATLPLPPKPITPVQPKAAPVGSPERIVINPRAATPKDEPQYEMDDMM